MSQPKATMTDNLVNLVSGLGTSRDKRSYSEFTHTDLGQAYLGTLYRNWMFGKVVDIPADDMTRKWRTPKAPSLTIEDLELFTKVEKELKIRATVNEALKWARLYGGAGLILNVNDGLGELSDPLELDRIKEGDLESVVAVDRYDLTAVKVNTRDVASGFRLPEFYQLAGGGHIHHSRIIRFDGFKLPWDELQRNMYWGGSVAERVYDEILNAKITTQSIASLIFESSVDVITVKGLFERIMNKQGLDAIMTRFRLANMTKSINKALIIDQDQETFQKHTTNFSGLPPMISEFYSVIAAAADIPATRMLGQSAKGFSATGQGDLDNYYDMISSKQETDLYDALGKLDQVLTRSVFGRPVEDWDFEFNPLQQMDEKQQAEINKLDSEAAANELQAGVITLSQWAAQLLAKGVYPTLDSEWVESLEGMEELEAENMMNQLDEPDQPGGNEGQDNDMVDPPVDSDLDEDGQAPNPVE
jgi:phage-related protein (TIGR01555 family)